MFIFPSESLQTICMGFTWFCKRGMVKKVIFILQQAYLTRPEELETSFEEIANDGAKHFLSSIRHFLCDWPDDFNRVKDTKKETEDGDRCFLSFYECIKKEEESVGLLLTGFEETRNKFYLIQSKRIFGTI